MITEPKQYISCDRCMRKMQYDGYLPHSWSDNVSHLNECWQHLCDNCMSSFRKWVQFR